MAGCAALNLGMKMLDQVQNIGQVAELGQNHVHQKEQIHWTKRNYHLDAQSLRLDALDHAKEEIRSHYDTYAGRIDTLLLVLALIWPFSLNTIQFSDPFVPKAPELCEDECVEQDHPWLIYAWVGLMGLILILPFWGILMLIRCKLKLDKWLEYSLAGLNRERREIVSSSYVTLQDSCSGDKMQELMQKQDDETEKIVYRLVNVVLEYQEYLAKIWTAECGFLVHASTMLLWISAAMALGLTSLSMWIFLANTHGVYANASSGFGALIVSGVLAPLVYIVVGQFRSPVTPPEHDSVDMFRSSFPLTSPRVRKEISSRVVSANAAGLSAEAQSAQRRAPAPLDDASLGSRSPDSSQPVASRHWSMWSFTNSGEEAGEPRPSSGSFEGLMSRPPARRVNGQLQRRRTLRGFLACSCARRHLGGPDGENGMAVPFL
eukprot:TRINITY_DN11113_c0_g3_i1.p1 TRINITY_DN11113_c0_g3~~TRINITY_DN11113_c0_g3_i1.p1  ORF type:complete len:487 (+),score=81.64 TRINITY_DN11113_c0_g3_i1:165-1463(+)